MMENGDMPKVLVLFSSDESSAASLAELAAAGAHGVRFTEVDIRVVASSLHSTANGLHKILESSEAARHYDGLIIVDGRRDGWSTSETSMDRLFKDWNDAAPHVFTNTVFGVAGSPTEALLGRVAALGGIIVTSTAKDSDPETRAGIVGARVAKVVEWVRHALSHEHSHHHHSH
jgi:hypothetical protein